MGVLNDPGMRLAMLSVAGVALTALVKWLLKMDCTTPYYKVVSRVVVVAVVGVGAALLDWSGDGVVEFTTWWAQFWPAITGAEFTYQWAAKYVGNINPSGGNKDAEACSCGCDGALPRRDEYVSGDGA